MSADPRRERLGAGRIAALLLIVAAAAALRLWAGLPNPIDLHELKLAQAVHLLLSGQDLPLTGVRVHESPLSGGPLIYIYLKLASALCPTFYGPVLAELLIAALAALGVYAAGRRALGSRGALWAAAIYALAPLYFLTAFELDNNRVAVPFLVAAAWSQAALLARAAGSGPRLVHMLPWALSWLLLLQINFTPILIFPAFALPALLAWPRRRLWLPLAVLLAAGLLMSGLLYAFSFTTGVEVPRRLGQLAAVQIGRTGVADALSALLAYNRLMGGQLLAALSIAALLCGSALLRLGRGNEARPAALFDLWLGLWLLCGHLGVVAFEPRLMEHYLAVTYPAHALLLVRTYQLLAPRLARLLGRGDAPRRGRRLAACALLALLGLHGFALLLGFHLVGHLQELKRLRRLDPGLAQTLELVDVRTLDRLLRELGELGVAPGFDGSALHAEQLDVLHLYAPHLAPWFEPVALVRRTPLILLGPEQPAPAGVPPLAEARGFKLLEYAGGLNLEQAQIEQVSRRADDQVTILGRPQLPLPRLRAPILMRAPAEGWHRIHLPVVRAERPPSSISVVLSWTAPAAPRVALRLGDRSARPTGRQQRRTIADDRRWLQVTTFDVRGLWPGADQALIDIDFRQSSEEPPGEIEYMLDVVQFP